LFDQSRFAIIAAMSTITIERKEYRALKAAKARLEMLSNQYSRQRHAGGTPLADLVGVLSDALELKGKTSVEVQHMIPKLWHQKRSS
jgi:hypothetical protein